MSQGVSTTSVMIEEREGRVGAIKGQILDADGTAVIYDLFTEFGVTAYTEVDFDLDNASPAPGVVKKKCHDIRRKIEDELGVVPYDHIHAMCGPDFFDDLITHRSTLTALLQPNQSLIRHRPRHHSSCGNSTPPSSPLASNPHRAACIEAAPSPRFRALALVGRLPSAPANTCVAARASDKPAQKVTSMLLLAYSSRLVCPIYSLRCL